MIRTAIIDDESQARAIVRSYVERYGDKLVVVGEADGVQSGLDLIAKERPDLVFLDVRMLDGTGFDLLCSLPEVHFKVIFVTAYDEFALRAFRFNAIDYLLKPLNPREFREAMGKVGRGEAPVEDLRRFAEDRTKPRHLTLKTAESIHLVQLDDIVRCKSDNSYTTVFLRDGKSIIVSRSIKDIGKQLPDSQFVRTHQSHIINFFFIKRFDRSTLRLQLLNGQEVPVATRRKDLVLSLLEKMG